MFPQNGTYLLDYNLTVTVHIALVLHLFALLGNVGKYMQSLSPLRHVRMFFYHCYYHCDVMAYFDYEIEIRKLKDYKDIFLKFSITFV
jgi:hypothetical protein